MVNETEGHPPIAQRLCILLLKHAQWVKEELKMVNKSGIIARSVSLLYSLIIIVLKKAQLCELSQKPLCMDYHAVKSPFPH